MVNTTGTFVVDAHQGRRIHVGVHAAGVEERGVSMAVEQKATKEC